MNDTGTRQRRGRPWPLLLTGAALFLAGAAAATVYTVYFKGSPREVPPDAAPPVVVGDISPKIHQFCGACHQYPPPDTFPRSAWRQEVERGYVFFENSSLHMRPPPLEAVIKHFEDGAPLELPSAAIERAATPCPVQFTRTGYP